MNCVSQKINLTLSWRSYLLFHANSQSFTDAPHITKFLENPGIIHDAASLTVFEANVDPHGNAQLATIL